MPLQEGLLGTTIILIAIFSEPLAIKIGYLDADFTSRLFDAAPPAETWGTMFAPARGFAPLRAAPHVGQRRSSILGAQLRCAQLRPLGIPMGLQGHRQRYTVRDSKPPGVA